MGYPRDASVQQLFDAQARRSPDAVALVAPEAGTRLTYGELAAWSMDIATMLRSEGVRPGDRVAILMHRSSEMVAAMLGILRAGAAYVPLDPGYPQPRLDFMVRDTAAAICLAQDALRRPAAATGARALTVPPRRGAATAAEPTDAVAADQAAYVIYTSGSTGEPKGVVVPHRAIVRLVSDQQYATFDASRVFLQLAPASFDAATFETWGALLHGARLVLAPDGAPDLPRLGELIAAEGVTTLWLTASLFNTIIDQAPAVLGTAREVLTGGEALSEPHVRKAQQLLPSVQLINGYGPTESTTFACCYRIPRPLPADWRAIPIGTAIAHTTVRLLDEQLADVPRGETGDLYLGGDGLAIGYLHRPELTAERFIVHPDGTRLYRTGDRARMRDDGALDFLGRLDDQVKIRGHRVELGEIEAALRKTPGVGDAVVALREDTPGDKRLVAYYTVAGGAAAPPASSLRAALAAVLPGYMVPSLFVSLEGIPLTPNGKADRRALPAPGRRRPALERAALAPRTKVETWLAGLWREVLQLDEVGVQDRFFELGGTSITAMRFLARLREETRADLPALLLFRAPTVADLAAILEREHAAVLPVEGAPAAAPLAATGTAGRAAARRDELAERRMRRKRAN